MSNDEVRNRNDAAIDLTLKDLYKKQSELEGRVRSLENTLSSLMGRMSDAETMAGRERAQKAGSGPTEGTHGDND